LSGIQVRGPHQYRVQVRRNGVTRSKTFETLREAKEWQRVMEGKVTGEELVDLKKAHSTTLCQACDWAIEGKHAGTGSNAKNLNSKFRYWMTTELADWSLAAIHDWDLIEWRRKVLDEDAAEDDEIVGPEAECGPQTVIHRLNALSKLIQIWRRAHKVALENPVVPGVRPRKPDGRDRRLLEGEERKLLRVARKSSRAWLRAAIAISLESCVRQGELAGLIWRRVMLGGDYPYLDLPKTKNDRPRRVPLSKRAVAAFTSIKPKGTAQEIAEKTVLSVETPRGIIHAYADAMTDKEFPDLRWHDLRHEAISRLFERTDLRDHEIMAITGHLTPAMLARYTHLRADRLGAKLPGGKLHRAA
jgi:integrase